MDAESQAIDREIELIADAVGELVSRMGEIEQAHTERLIPLEAAAATTQSALAGIHALTQAIRALNAPISESSLESVMGKLDALSRQNAEVAQAFDAQKTETEQRVHQFSRLEQEARTKFTQQLDDLRAEVAQQFASQFSMNPCGCYDPNRAYKRGDLVELNGSSFISLENANREKPSKKSKRWMLSAGRGGSVVLGANNTQGGLIIIAEDSDSVTVEA